MDTNLNILKDNKRQIEGTIKKIRNNKEKYKAAELSDKKKIKDQFNYDFRAIKEILSSMDLEIATLKSEEAEIEYKGVISNFKAQVKELMEEIKNIDTMNDKQTKNLNLEEIELVEKPLDKLTVQEAFDRGTKVLNDGDAAIARMDRIIKETKEVGGNIKQNLLKQREQLVSTQKNLKEIDYSLDRAAKTLRSMLRTYYTDKIILILIVIICLAIIAIIIVAAVGGDKGNNFNAPHDIFSSKNRSITNSTTS